MKVWARAAAFLSGVREELRQVTWPTRDEVAGSALVVFVGVALLGAFISVVDFLLSRGARWLLQ
jgi:preprotein translocase subunit SecE